MPKYLRRVRALTDRFWEKVQKTDSCWLWVGTRKANGYGVLGLGRQGEGHAYVHRLAWAWANGPIPTGQWVCHRCDVRNCVRPEHLFVGTPRQNVADMFSKGRQATPAQTRRTGEANGRARLTAAQAQEAMSLHAGGATIAAIARTFGVGETTIRNIVQGRRWVDATGLSLRQKLR